MHARSGKISGYLMYGWHESFVPFKWYKQVTTKDKTTPLWRLQTNPTSYTTIKLRGYSPHKAVNCVVSDVYSSVHDDIKGTTVSELTAAKQDYSRVEIKPKLSTVFFINFVCKRTMSLTVAWHNRWDDIFVMEAYSLVLKRRATTPERAQLICTSQSDW